MAAIYLIRHGQASFGKADYDQLSEKGCKQAEMLGKYWQHFPDTIKTFSGDLLRHAQTLEHFKTGIGRHNFPLTTHSGFNEYDHVDILTCYNENWRNLAKMSEQFAGKPDANKQFQAQFNLALSQWINCQERGVYKESWSEFKQRCIQALESIMRQHLDEKSSVQSDDMLIFTSGGTISVILQHILGLPEQQTLRMNQQLRNTSVTKILFSKEMLSVDYINNYSHLSSVDDSWVTFR